MDATDMTTSSGLVAAAAEGSEGRPDEVEVAASRSSPQPREQDSDGKRLQLPQEQRTLLRQEDKGVGDNSRQSEGEQEEDREDISSHERASDAVVGPVATAGGVGNDLTSITDPSGTHLVHGSDIDQIDQPLLSTPTESTESPEIASAVRTAEVPSANSHKAIESTPAWREGSAFDALDESWADPAQGIESRSSGEQHVASEAAHDDLVRSRDTSLNAERVRRPSTETVTGSGVLRPGPSSPTYRLASHRMPSTDGEASLNMSFEVGTEAQDPGTSQHQGRTSSPLLTGRSLSSSSSGEKQGSRALAGHTHLHGDDIDPSRERGMSLNEETRQNAEEHVAGVTIDPNEETNVHHYGSAREFLSNGSVLVGAVTAEEPTFIEHSEVGPMPDFMKPGWARKDRKGRGRDIFTPLKLETMFDPPSFARVQAHPSEEAVASSNAHVLMAEQQQEELARTDRQSEREEANESSRLEKQHHVRDYGTDTSSSQASHDVASEDEDIERTAPSDSRPPKLAARGQFTVPQCVFTFASPNEAVRMAAPPPTPAHAPLRLLQLRNKNAEIEQILNTPRSPEKAADAKRIVWELVAKDDGVTGVRDTKRLRLDRLPSPSPAEVIVEEEDHIGAQRLSHSNVPRESTPIDSHAIGLQDRPKFMDRLRKLQSLVDKEPRQTSRSAESDNRERVVGARLTPGFANRDTARPANRESPRKLLRRWSAANEVDEELQQNQQDEEVLGENDHVALPRASPMSGADERDDSGHELLTKADDERSANDPATASRTHQLSRPASRVSMKSPVGIDEGLRAEEAMEYHQDTGNWVRAQRKVQQLHLAQESADPFRDGNSNRQVSPRDGVNRTESAGDEDAGIRSAVHITVSDMTQSNSVPTERSNATPGEKESHFPMLATPAKGANGLAIPTPRSILKTGGSRPRALPSSINRATARSISFADGHETRQDFQTGRAEKVEILLRQLAALALGPDDKSIDLSFSEQLTPTRPTIAENTKRARSPWNLSTLRGHREAENGGEASFLTNASFDVAHDRLLELITDVAPFEDDWRDLRTIDLRGRRVESLNRMKEFLPRLESALLDDNEINYLSGLPSSLRSLSIARNRLPTSAAFGAFTNLEMLDVSHNSIDLKALSKLSYLKHLKADENDLSSIEGIQHLTLLETLHLRNNRIKTLNVARGQWPLLRDLVLSHNKLVDIQGLSNLQKLRSLNLDHNRLEGLDLEKPMPMMRQLRLSGNRRLAALDVGSVRKLRTLYADECALDEILNIGHLQKLDNLSLRQQHGVRGLHWPAREIRDIKRLFLSGNAFRAINLGEVAMRGTTKASLGARAIVLAETKFYAMVYLELSACQLTSLPAELADMVPNLRHLNADYNLLQTLPVMSDLKRLKRLSLVGCRLDPSRILVESLQGCDELLSLDVRMNPCTLGLYPPILIAAPLLSAPGLHGHQRGMGKGVSQAFLPPVPHPSLARPDKNMPFGDTSPTRRARARAPKDSVVGDMGEKSFFHKRKPPPPLFSDASDPDSSAQDESDEDELIIEPTIKGSRLRRGPAGKNKSGKRDKTHNAFYSSDHRFVRTLPSQFRLQRLLHRGTMAMACPNLTWLDGLVIDEDEVRQADEYYKSRLRGVDAAGQFLSEGSSPESLLSSSASEADLGEMNARQQRDRVL